MLLYNLPLDILCATFQKLSLEDIGRLYATNDNALCKLLVSARVIPKIELDIWEAIPMRYITLHLLKKHSFLLEFDCSRVGDPQLGDILLSSPRPSLLSLSLHGAIASPTKLNLADLARQETFASLFPSLKTLKICGQSSTITVCPRNAFLQRLCAKLPDGLTTLHLNSRNAWPTLESLPSSITDLSVLHPLTIEDYARHQSAHGYGTLFESNAPAYDMLCALHSILPNLTTLMLRTSQRMNSPDDGPNVFNFPLQTGLLPSLLNLSIRPSGESVDELSLITSCLPSVQELTIWADELGGFSSRKLNFKPSFVLPPTLTTITVIGGTLVTSPSVLLSEHFFNAWPPSLVLATLRHVTATFGAKTVIPHAMGAGGIPPFFGGGAAGRGIGGAGFFQPIPVDQAVPQDLEKTWDPSLAWTAILPKTLRRLVLTHTDFDLRALPEMLEYLEVSDSRELNPAVAAGDRALPRPVRFPPGLTHLQMPLIIINPTDIGHLPSSLKYLQCGLSDEWTQHDLKTLLQVQCPLATFASPTSLDFTWNDKEKAIARQFMCPDAIEALEIDFSFAKLIIEWLGKDLYLRCAHLKWRIGAPHSVSNSLEDPQPLDGVPIDAPASESFNFPEHSSSTSNTGWFGRSMTGLTDQFGFGIPSQRDSPTLPSARPHHYPDLVLSPSTRFADLRYTPNGEIGEMSEHAITAHLVSCPNLEVLKAVLEGTSSHPMTFMYPRNSKLAQLSCLTTLQLEGVSFLRVPFSSLPRSLTSLVSHKRSNYALKLPFGEYQNVSMLPRGLTRLEAPTILLGAQKTESWPPGLTSLIFCPFEWDDVHVRALQRQLPLQKFHLCARIFYTGELEIDLPTTQPSSSMDIDQPTSSASKSIKRMRDLPVFALHSLVALVSRELAPATFINIEVRRKFTSLISPQIETIELMNVATTFGSLSRRLPWQSASGSLYNFNEYIDHIAKGDTIAESPALALPVAQKPSPFATFNITFTSAELSKYVYLTSFKLSTHSLGIEEIAVLPKTLAELSIVMQPNEQLQTRMDFKPFPKHLTSLSIISNAKLTLNRQDMDEVPKSLTKLSIPALRISSESIPLWKSLNIMNQLEFDGNAVWTDSDIMNLSSIMAGGDFELLEVWNACITGTFADPNATELSAYSLVFHTNTALSSRCRCHWKQLATPLAPLPKALQTLDLSGARMSAFGRYALSFPSTLTSLTLRLEKQLLPQELMALPQSLRILRLYFDCNPPTHVILDPNFWACLPSDLEELVVDHLIPHWLDGQSCSSNPPYAFHATLHDPPILNFETPPFAFSNFTWGDPQISPCIISSIPYLAASRLRTLILPSHVLNQECLHSIRDTLERLHVYHLEDGQNLTLALRHKVDFFQVSLEEFKGLPSPLLADVMRTHTYPSIATPGGGYFVSPARLPAPANLDPSIFHIRDNSTIYTRDDAAQLRPFGTVSRRYYWN